jgi:hypothetical protein
MKNKDGCVKQRKEKIVKEVIKSFRLFDGLESKTYQTFMIISELNIWLNINVTYASNLRVKIVLLMFDLKERALFN